MMTFKEQYRTEVERVVPDEAFEIRLRERLRQEAPGLKVVRVANRWKTWTITLAAACFVLMVGVGVLVAARGGVDSALMQNDMAPESSEAYTMTAEAVPEEDQRIEGSAENDGVEAEKETPAEEKEEEREASSDMTLAGSANGGAGVWLDGVFATCAGDLLRMFADCSEVVALASPGAPEGRSTANVNNLQVAALTADEVTGFADGLYRADVLYLNDGEVYDPATGEAYTLDESVAAVVAVCLSDGTSFRLTLYPDGTARAGALPVLFRLGTDSAQSVLDAFLG